MTLIERISSFFKRLFFFLKNKEEPIKELVDNLDMSKKTEENDAKSESENNMETTENEDEKISSYGRTIKAKLYSLEQDITVFEYTFPDDFKRFSDKISSLRDLYNSNLEEYNNRPMLTLTVHPGTDGDLLFSVYNLEREIRVFIEKDVKFGILSKRMERFLCKLSILYNVSIFNPNEQEKVIRQLDNAKRVEYREVDELKQCNRVLEERDLLERMISLFSYADYLIFKTRLRNSSENPCNLLLDIVCYRRFNNFDYSTTFKDFALDEISDLLELLPLLKDVKIAETFKISLQKLLEKATYGDPIKLLFSDSRKFWESLFGLENVLLNALEYDEVSKEKIKVKLLDKMDIKVKEDEVIAIPKNDSIIALKELFSKSHDARIELLVQVLSSISDKVTYKDIYYLVVLFEAIDVLNKYENALIDNLDKYLKKHPYSQSSIEAKKRDVINQSSKEYIPMFRLTNYKEEMIDTLERLNIDFKVTDGIVYINSFYFNGLSNIRFEINS